MARFNGRTRSKAESRIVDHDDSPDVRDSKESLGDAFGSGDLQMSFISDRKM